jgi:sugar/nucleoside kinase (ribokinase family)
VDTLGAGDAFNGGFIAACLAKLDVREAARWGNAVAALKIGRTGARGLPSLEELRQLVGHPYALD